MFSCETGEPGHPSGVPYQNCVETGGPRSARSRHLQSRGTCDPGGGPTLQEQWKEQIFTAGAADKHPRTEGMRDEAVVCPRRSMRCVGYGKIICSFRFQNVLHEHMTTRQSSKMLASIRCLIGAWDQVLLPQSLPSLDLQRGM